MRFSVCEVQPVPYEPCHGRPDSQPARPRLPPGCGSRSRSSPSAGGPPPPRTPGLRHIKDLPLKSCHMKFSFRSENPPRIFLLTAALVDCSGFLVQVVRIGLVQVEALRGVGHRRAVLRLVGERGARWQNWAGQVGLRAAMRVPLVRQLTHRTQTTDVPFRNSGSLCSAWESEGEREDGNGELAVEFQEVVAKRPWKDAAEDMKNGQQSLCTSKGITGGADEPCRSINLKRANSHRCRKYKIIEKLIKSQ